MERQRSESSQLTKGAARDGPVKTTWNEKRRGCLKMLLRWTRQPLRNTFHDIEGLWSSNKVNWVALDDMAHFDHLPFLGQSVTCLLSTWRWPTLWSQDLAFSVLGLKRCRRATNPTLTEPILTLSYISGVVQSGTLNRIPILDPINLLGNLRLSYLIRLSDEMQRPTASVTKYQ
jgi:hypothetical protein